ncbi:MAG: hypothetical protein AAGE84_23475 [Cyanobacteria bacterium P01_G01_bin.39]
MQRAHAGKPFVGGFPHERHRAYRLKAAPQRWRIRAVQEATALVFTGDRFYL